MFNSPDHSKYFDLKVFLFLCLLTISLLIAFKSSAQNNSSGHKYFSIQLHGTGASAINEFYYASDHLMAGGVDLSIYYHPRNVDKIYIGAGFSYLNYGLEKYDQDVLIDGQHWEVETLRQYDIYFPYLKLKFLPWDQFRLVPVFNAFTGPMAMATVSTFSYEEEPTFLNGLFRDQGEENTVTETEYIDWTFAYGFSAGINYYVCRFFELEALISYIDGGMVKYLRKNDIDFDPGNNEFIYTPRESRSNMIQLSFGFVIHLF